MICVNKQCKQLRAEKCKQTSKESSNLPDSSGRLSSSLDFSSVLRLRPLGDLGVEVMFVGSDSFGFGVEAAEAVASLGLRPLLAGGGVSLVSSSLSLAFLLPENCKKKQLKFFFS